MSRLLTKVYFVLLVLFDVYACAYNPLHAKTTARRQPAHAVRQIDYEVMIQMMFIKEMWKRILETTLKRRELVESACPPDGSAPPHGTFCYDLEN